ncbi:MAG: DUF2147 domain-containing protein [Saprospiraceae bacterium]|nr:DUF2147 domain-containing protein [Saprospiraceae bacterium]
MRIILSIGLVIVGVMISSAQSTLEGIWHTAKDNTLIETYQKEGAWYGKVIESDNPKAKIGNDILRGFKQVDGQWLGKLYAAKRNREADAIIEPTEEQLTIVVSAGFNTRTLVWKRANKE